MKKKIAILFLSLLGSLLLYVTHHSVRFGLCEASDISCRSGVDLIEQGSYLFLVSMFFSLITFAIADKFFSAWWNFARVALPTLFLIIVVLNLKLHHTGSQVLSFWPAIDFVVQIALYIVFTLGSLISLFIAYKRSDNRQ